MRRGSAAAACMFVAVLTGCGTTASPRLALSAATIRGTGFGAGEIVRLDFSAGGTRTIRRMRADARGSLSFRIPRRDPCLGDLLVVARGARGDTARLKLPRRACPPAARSS